METSPREGSKTPNVMKPVVYSEEQWHPMTEVPPRSTLLWLADKDTDDVIFRCLWYDYEWEELKTQFSAWTYFNSPHHPSL